MYLDPSIRDWVLFPIMLVMILVGLLRHNVTLLMSSAPKVTLKAIRETQALTRARLLRTSSAYLIPFESFESRKTYFISAFGKKLYHKNPEAQGNPNPMTDPAGMEMMMDGMKKQFTQIIPQTVIMSWVTFFFSGFVLIKLPFPLTIRFKSMLQRDILTKDMDATWVSSLSWYFLNLFGLKSIFTILGEDNAASIGDIHQMQMMGGAQAQQPQDMNKIFQSESEFLELSRHQDDLESIERTVLNRYLKQQNLQHDRQLNLIEKKNQ